jgi:hypothetical protein
VSGFRRSSSSIVIVARSPEVSYLIMGKP